MKNKFLEITKSATKSDVDVATGWYDQASDLASKLSTLGDLNFDQSCCIIAAFSIRQRWTKNVELATRFASGERDLPVMGAINRIANNIVESDDPYSALNGDKTNAFAHNIAGDVSSVTIDVWMIRAAGLDPKKSLGKKAYKEVSDALTEASIEYGMAPAHYQALVWCIIRGESA